MKLRLRSSESKQTQKLDIPNPCTLPLLKQILSQSLPDSPSPSSIRLSLNRLDELQSSDALSPLSSLGITSGDLIFFSLHPPTPDPAPFSPKNPIHPQPESSSSFGFSGSGPRESAESEIPVCSTSFHSSGSDPDPVSQNPDDPEPASKIPVCSTIPDSTGSGQDPEMEVDGVSEGNVDRSFSEPGFLRKVYMEDGGRDHKLIVMAVHAVLIESGFVESGNGGWGLPSSSSSSSSSSGVFTISLCYTLPGGVLNVTCVVKFQRLGKFVNVYGSVSGGGGGGKARTWKLTLDEDRLVPFLNVVWANCGVREGVMDGSVSGTSAEKVVFEFWRVAKDSFALPLLIDMCEKVGLGLPPCFMRLPTDMKMKILESLPGVDVAKVSCVCSELRYLASNDDLWKKKFEEEYGKDLEKGQGSWKMAFVRVRENRKSAKAFAGYVVRNPPMPRWRRYGYQPGLPRMPQRPRIIGGDYDIYGNDALQNDVHGVFPHRFANRNFSPLCNLGGSASTSRTSFI